MPRSRFRSECAGDFLPGIPATIRAFFRGSLPDIDDYRLIYLKTCFYTTTADDRFVLRKRDRLLLFSGCSGHGYKFAAFNGEKLAQVVLGEAEFEATAKLLGGYEPAAGGNGQTT